MRTHTNVLISNMKVPRLVFLSNAFNMYARKQFHAISEDGKKNTRKREGVTDAKVKNKEEQVATN